MTIDEITAGLIEAECYEMYGDDLVRFATAIVGPSDAQDVVSQAMAKLLSNGGLRDAENQRALMYRTAFNEAKSLQRSSVRRRLRERKTAKVIAVHDPDIRPDVLHAVLRLSPRQRACVWLAYWADLGTTDIAEYLDISDGSVKQHLSRARQNLKEVLDE
jgi:RNA polymerase sigma-70 factor (ECF subfamily)